MLLKSLAAWVSVTLPLPALTTVAPLITAGAVCVMAPLVFSVRLVALIAFRARKSVAEGRSAAPVAPMLLKVVPGLASGMAPLPALAAVALLATMAPAVWLM